MAQMVHGQWVDGLNRPKTVRHFHAEGRQVSFGPTLCGLMINPTSKSETTDRPEWVNCKNCKRGLGK